MTLNKIAGEEIQGGKFETNKIKKKTNQTQAAPALARPRCRVFLRVGEKAD